MMACILFVNEDISWRLSEGQAISNTPASLDEETFFFVAMRY